MRIITFKYSKLTQQVIFHALIFDYIFLSIRLPRYIKSLELYRQKIRVEKLDMTLDNKNIKAQYISFFGLFYIGRRLSK